MWLNILLLIIQYGPAIWKLVQEIIDMINGVSEFLPESETHIFQNTKKSQLRMAVKHYRKTKDKTPLNEMHGELSCQLSNYVNRD